MLTQKQAEEVIKLIEGNYLGPAFTKLNEWQVNDTFLGGLEREYLSNRYDYTLSDRLMFFVNKQANTNIDAKPIHYDIFFSYSSKNQNEAEEQVKYLREHGISVFFSNDNLKNHAGSSFIGKINDALNNSKHFLLYCTPEAVASTYVQHECDTFLGKHISKGKVNKIFIIEGDNFNTKLLEKIYYQNIQTTDIDFILKFFGKTSKKEQEKQQEYLKKQEQQLTQEQQKLDALEKQKQILLLQKQKKQEQEKLQREIKKLEEEQNTNNNKKTIFYTVGTILVVLVLIFFIRGGTIFGGGEKRENDTKEDMIAEKEKPAEEEAKPEAPEGMVFIKGGTFLMGSPESEVSRNDNEDQHSVSVSSFYMAKYEVTVEEYEKYCTATNTKMPNAPDFNPNWKNKRHPIVNVSWEDATTYCAWLSKTTGKKYRLPTEAEWEYACRAGTTTPFSTGANLTTAQGNYNGNYPYNNNAKGVYRQGTTEVGSFSPNAWGLYDMHGNVWEWCQDYYNSDYNGIKESGFRVLRGGSWNYLARHCRSAYRHYNTPTYRSYANGFRFVISF
ncbi:MAG: TIR domain-containing protein [Bacteroidetes bacterium]|nr:MAG: TIR domain-containing protein [Bacteroidota bacterium]TAG87480.1 MAG: TIR domain-containing protein [Bacteroidota bacterium]